MDWEKIRTYAMLISGIITSSFIFGLGRFARRYKLEVYKLELEIKNLKLDHDIKYYTLQKLKKESESE